MASTEAVVAEEGEEGVPLVVTGLVEPSKSIRPVWGSGVMVKYRALPRSMSARLPTVPCLLRRCPAQSPASGCAAFRRRWSAPAAADVKNGQGCKKMMGSFKTRVNYRIRI